MGLNHFGQGVRLEVFDFIVIGAGSAGCAVVEGLSRSGTHRVLVIEAGGPDRNPWIKVPIGYAMTFANRSLNWSYTAEADAGLNGRSAYWPRGRVIGGSSSINAMAYMRGLPVDYDIWEQMGATGWGWRDVRPAFDAMEQRMTGDGPVYVADLSDRMNPFSRRFLEAGDQMGWPQVPDISTLTGTGIGYYRSTVRNGFRFSAADAFLKPALRRPNVRCVTRALVEKVIVENGRAVGVQYSRGNQRHIVRAAGEVILSAGAINSPKLLQLSGIGPAPDLRALGIPVVHDLSQVGQGLQDHLAVSYQFRATEPTLNNRLGRLIPRVVEGAKYVLTRRGALSVPVNQVGGYAKSSPELADPDLQIYCNPMSYAIDANGTPRTDREPGYLLCAQLCRPESRGHIRLGSADPADAPRIFPNSLATDYDRQGAVRAVEMVRRLAQAPALRAVTKGAIVPLPEPQDALEDFRNRAATVFHPTSTCRMGSDPARSVVDPRCRVHGVAGLRVIDASVFPTVTSGNTNAPALMVGMRAAQMVLADQAKTTLEQRTAYAT